MSKNDAYLDNWILAYPEQFLKQEHLRGRDWTLAISKIVVSEIELVEEGGRKKTEDKPIVHFDALKNRPDKMPWRWMIGKTSCRVLEGLYGRAMRDWVDKRITIFPDMTVPWRDRQTKEKRMGAIRVRPFIPPDPKSKADASSTDDSMKAHVASLWAALETALKEPDGVARLKAQVDALPDGADRVALQRSVERLERMTQVEPG